MGLGLHLLTDISPAPGFLELLIARGCGSTDGHRRSADINRGISRGAPTLRKLKRAAGPKAGGPLTFAPVTHN
jgi:hypothetical protein